MHSKNKILILITLIILTITSITPVSAVNGDVDDGNLILLKAGHINTNNVSEAEDQNYGSETQGLSTISMESSENYYIVQFTGPVRAIWKQEVTSLGAIIYDYVPNNAFVFKMTDDTKLQAQSLDFVKWIGEYRPSYKYEPQLAHTNGIQISSAKIDTESTYHVLLFPSEDYESIANSIELLGGNIISDSRNILKVQMSTDMLPEIATINGVSWIEEYVQPMINNDIASGIINVDNAHETYRLNGSGQIIAICDSGIDTGVNDNSMHADLRGRIRNIIQTYNDGSSADYNGHGTHVAGSVLGNGSLSSRQYSGMAPKAELVFQAAGDNAGNNIIYVPNDLNDLFQVAYDHGARIHTNSWGSTSTGQYRLESQQIDQFIWEHPDMLILFAAGNAGRDSNADGVIDKYSLDSQGTAKNCLTVGASENERGDTFGLGLYQNWGSGSWLALYPANPIRDDYMADNSKGIAAFSSRGPTEDGRIKPDVVAPGTFIISTRSSLGSSTGWGVVNDDYLYMGGTSMATPITAGSAALIRQYYTNVENLSSPSAALLKATIINGAMDLTPGQYGNGSTQEIAGMPDNSSGWGRVDVENSIYPQYPDVIEYFDDPEALNLSDSWNVSYNISEDSDILRATLVWTDHYNISESAEKALVNDLNLIIIAPDNTYYGNNGPDTVNNVEGVELTDPTPGTYTIKVNGTAIQIGPQNFSLVIYSTSDTNEYPQNGNYTTNSSTAVYLNLTHPYGINQSTISMTIDGSEMLHSLENITGGYKVENVTAQPYSEGYHNVSVTALTNQSEVINYEWQFYASVEDNVITIDGLAENSVKQEETFEINVINRKLCDFWYNVDNGDNSSIETGFSFNKTLNLTEGRHNLTVFAEDITGYTNSTTVNFTVFTSQATIDSPDSGTIYYLPTNSFAMNGTAGIATNVSTYINGAIVNDSYPVSNGIFNLSDIPLSNGTNNINISSSYNNSEYEYFSSNTSIYLILGETTNTSGADDVIIPVPGMDVNISRPAFNFNISGTSANPGNISAAAVTVNEPSNGSSLISPQIDIRVLNESDPDYSHQFGRNVSLTLGYNPTLVNDTGKIVVAWYNPDEEAWISYRSTVNSSEDTITTNITHLSVYAVIEDIDAPDLNNLTGSGSTSSITLTWENSADTDHVEVWRNGMFITNTTLLQITDTGLSSQTSYAYGLRAIDYVNNIGNWSNITVATTTQVSTSSGGGGGGGGGGGNTGEEYENIVFKDVLVVYAGKDSIVEFDFEGEENDIDYVKYLSLRNSGKISTTIEILANTSALVSEPPSELVYRNLNIWVGKTGYVNDDNLKDPVIGFRVGKKWINDENVDPTSVKLRRYSDEKWESLPTKRIEENNEYLYFEAITPGFSPFAITGLSLNEITENKAKTDNNALISSEGTNSGTKVNDAKKEESNNRSIPMIHPIFSALILILVGLLRRQQN